MKLPFAPKSTAHLEPGHYWSIPMSDGKYSCGVVLARVIRSGRIDTRIFLAGLLDWSCTEIPCASLVSYSRVIEKRYAHIKAILTTGGEVLGSCELAGLSQSPVEHTDDIATMGYNVFTLLAEKHFGD